jgi:hypothetical protein
VPSGVYGVSLTVPDGYALLEDLVGGPSTRFVDGLKVPSDSLPVVHFTLLKRGPGTITSSLAGVDGARLAGVNVTLYVAARVIDSATTDSNGTVTFANVPFGQYGLSFRRPFAYQSFARYQDSLYAFRDAIVVEDGSADSVRFVLPRCTAQLRVHVTDESGAPVVSSRGELYTSTDLIGRTLSDANGIAAYTTPCQTNMGVRALPPAGYVAILGRGTEFVDGLILSSGEVRDIHLMVRKLP